MLFTMHDYILDIPDAVLRNLSDRMRICSPITEHFTSFAYKRVVIIATGSSYNAALCALEGMKKNLGLPIEVITPFYFEHYFSAGKADYLIFASQSGYSTNVISAIRKAEKMSLSNVCVTGHLDSDLAKETNRSYDYGVGEETAGYVTKGVILLILYFWMFSAEAGKKMKKINQQEYDEWYRQIALAASNSAEMVNCAEKCFHNHKKEFLSMDKVILCGCGTGLATATEGALKISETVRIPCVVCDPEELLHGYYYQIDPGYTVFFISNQSETDERIDMIAHAVREVTDRVYVLKNAVDWRVSPIMQLPFFWELAYLVSSSLNSYALHPLAVNMKKWVSAKTENYRKDKKK